MTIHQVNADGAGPFVCDLDETSNAGIFRNLSVSDNVPGTNGLSQAKAQQFQIKITMPQDINCIGASTGNVCTVRCRNNAVSPQQLAPKPNPSAVVTRALLDP